VLTQALGATVTPMVCVHGAQLPWGELMAEGLPVLVADRLVPTLRILPPLLGEVHVALFAGKARQQLHSAVRD
jgi:hypothetical protein